MSEEETITDFNGKLCDKASKTENCVIKPMKLFALGNFFF